MPEESTAKSGTATESQQTQEGTTASEEATQSARTEGAKTFTQEEVNRLISKEVKPYKELKSELEKLREEKKQKEESEKSELEKMQTRVDELTPYKERYESLESYVSAELESIMSELSDEDRATVESLSVPVTEKIALGKRFLKTEAKPNGAAREGSKQSAATNTVEAQARQFLLDRGVREDNPLFKHQLDITMKQLSQ